MTSCALYGPKEKDRKKDYLNIKKELLIVKRV